MNTKPTQTIDARGHYDEPEDGKVIQVEAHDLAILNSSEIDMQITTAKKYPRSLTLFRNRIMELATLDVETALSCIYVVPRDGKNIEGPSARFAEILVSNWGNNRSGARIIGHDAEFITAQGFFFDLESNTALTYEVKRRITGRNGKTYSADMIMTTGNAAASIAHRNAALKAIPKALWEPAFKRAKEAIAGDVKTLNHRRGEMIKMLMAIGATQAQVYGLVGVAGLDDITTAHMVTLGGVYNAVREGELSVEEAFAPDKMAEGFAPPRPRQSEFERPKSEPVKVDVRAEDPKPEPDRRTSEPEKGAAEAEAETKPEPKPDPVADTGHPIETSSADDEAYANLKDAAYESLAQIAQIRGVGPLRDDVLKQLDTADHGAWIKACDARSKAIAESATGRRR